jgi:all-trans-retinol 13,14-reductase
MSKSELPWSKSVPAGPWDYIVIGSGMGGMTTAATLASLGRRVLVLEGHYVPGGFTHEFKRKRWHWDVGVHAIGEVTDKAILGRVLKALTGERLQWASLGDPYEEFHYPEGFRIDFPDNPKAYRDVLLEKFPHERTAIDRYFSLVRQASGAMRGYYLSRVFPERAAALLNPLLQRQAKRFTTVTLQSVLDELTTDERLKTVLAGQWGYYGSPPREGSFAIHAAVVRHFLHGAHYPIGGAGEIAKALLQKVADAGGWTAIRTEVDEILVERGRAVGVRLVGGEEIRAKRVVSAASALVTATKLLPPSERPKPWATGIHELPPAPAHLCAYLGFQGDIRAAGAGSANQWFWKTWRTDGCTWDWETEAEAPVLYTSYPSLKDPSHDPGPDLLHTGEIVTFVPYEKFAKWKGTGWMKRGAEYDALKADLLQRLLDGLFAHRPGLKPLLRHAELSTPITTEHFVRPAAGSIYGIASSPARYANPWLRPRTPVKDLFLSGCDVGAAGVMGAFVGGILCATAAEPLEVLPWLRRVNAGDASGRTGPAR